MDILDFVGQINLEESAGLQVEVLIADYQDVDVWPNLPDLAGGTDNEDYVTLTGAFAMKPGKKFQRWEGSLEKNSFGSGLVGSRGAKSHENTLTIQKNAVNAPLMGWLRANKNRQLVVAFKFLGETNYTVIGWRGLWAEMDEGTITVPGEVSGDKMTMCTIRSIFYPPLYIPAVPIAAGVLEVASLLIEEPVATAGDVTVTLDGSPTLISLLLADSAIDVATKIRATSFAGWTTGGTAGTATVTFTANTTGPKIDAVYSAGATGATGTMTTTTQGV